MANIIPIERIESKIYYIRGQKVMLDRDRAQLYGVENRTLNQAVKRKISRFPEDFMFQLSKEEFETWKSQIVISKGDKKGLRKRPHVFTEQGVAMLSSVLNSERAIAVNILIMRTFTRLRQMLSGYSKLKRKIENMEKKYDTQFKVVFKAIKELVDKKKQVPKKRRIGFITEK